jgi:c-di-GMP-binding flagellar brake protein YcgR
VKEQNEVVVTESGVPYRRRYVRVAVSMPVVYARDGENDTSSLRFALPEVEREIVVRGRIVLSFYNAEDGRFFHGVVFTHINPSDQDEIVRYVASEVQRRAAEDDLEGDPAE